MATKNLNTLPTGGALQSTDIFLGNNFAASHLDTYMVGGSSSLNNSSVFWVAPLSTGRRRTNTGLEVKNFINGSNAVFKSNDLVAVTRSGIVYKVTALAVKQYINGSALSAPGNMTAVAQSSTSILVDWDDSAGALTYTLQRALNSGFTGVVTTLLLNSPDTDFLDTGLDSSTTYYYRVKAEDADTPINDSTYATAFETPGNFSSNIYAMSGLVAALDVTDAGTITTSGGKLVTCTDKGPVGNGDYDATADSSQRPDYFASGGPNDKPYVEFAGSELTYLGPSTNPLSPATSPVTAYIVTKMASLGADKYVRYTGTGGGGPTGVMLKASQLAMMVYTGVAEYDYHKSGYNTNWQIIRMVIKQDDVAYVRINRNPDFPIDTTGGDGSMSIIYNHMSTGGQKACESLTFNRLLTPAEDDEVLNYLAGKYQILAPANSMICLGDSHTVGLYASTGNTYVELIAAGEGFTMHNFAVSGTTMKDYAYNQSNGKSLADYAPIFAKAKWANFSLLLAYGTNDAAVHDAQGVSMATWKTDFKAIIQTFIDAGFDPAKIYVPTPPYSTGSYVDGWLDEHADKILEIQDEMSLPVIDWYYTMQTDGHDLGIQGDFIHGGDTHHLYMSNKVRAVMP